ncbi:MAG: hypothetical protein HY236_00180 [Acidobacteria bacterium]|nr:hypothetical protein [Acidobacteriota bacterium]
MLRSKSVIFVGNNLETSVSSLLAHLRSEGFHLIETASPEDLPALLEENPSVAIVAYDARGEDTARQVLRALPERRKKTPVIVVVDQGAFEQYYELMCEGAYDYFELTSGVEVIERAVRWAVGTRTAAA